MNRKPERELRHIRLLLQQRRFRDALNILEPLRTKHPDDFDVVYLQGLALALSGDLAEAIDAYCHAVTLQPGHVEAHTQMGLVLAKGGDYDRALEYFEWSLHIEPTNIDALRACGGVLLQLGRDEEALATWGKLGDAVEGMIEVQFGLGQIYENKGELGKAEEYYRKVLLFQEDTIVHELVRIRLARITEGSTSANGELRMSVVMYCLSALQQFTRLERVKVHRIILEIGVAMTRGVDVNDPTRKYHLKSLPGVFTGLQLAAYLYTGFKVVEKEMNIGLDFSKEYELACELWEKEKKNG